MAFLYTREQTCAPGRRPDVLLGLPGSCEGECLYEGSEFTLAAIAAPPVLRAETVAHSSAKLMLTGFSNPESQFRWAEGKQGEIAFYTRAEEFEGTLELGYSVLGQQHFTLRLNGNILFDGALSGWNEQLLLHFDPDSLRPGSVNELVIDQPDAHSPGGSDTRVLGMALWELTLR